MQLEVRAHAIRVGHREKEIIRQIKAPEKFLLPPKPSSG
jgi:hypothetical protein